MKPELLAVRAINQYRRRDVLAYLGLRYYLENDCAKNDIWARDISVHLVNTRNLPIYFRSCHFKEIEDDRVIHRNIYLPGANEILAESALIYDCSKEPAFNSLECVYSYQFPDLSSKEGIFKNYFPRFQKRNISIAKVCKDLGGSATTVLYTDIKKFYPSIPYELALKVWNSTCNSSNISAVSREIGERLLAQYAEMAKSHNEGLGILTGPMFSHLIANLILAEVDKQMVQYTKEKYWRYVDDFVLVGSADEVKKSRNHLSSILKDMGFSLHDEGKDFEVESTVWLKTFEKYERSKINVWTNLIANIKRFLITKPEERGALKQAFSEQGINIPLLNYANTVAESSYREQFYNWLAKHRWAFDSVRVLSVDKLVNNAVQTREIYYQKMNMLLGKNYNIGQYERKQLISKLRFYAMRLSYLASSSEMLSISNALSTYRELCLQSRVMNAIHSQDVSSLVKLGVNAVQAAAQILRIQGNTVRCSLDSFGEVELQGLAILRLNGIEVKLNNVEEKATINDPLNQFALSINSAGLMKSEDLFIKEIACLRGIEGISKHKYFLDSAFDRDEQLSFDIIDQLQVSSYF